MKNTGGGGLLGLAAGQAGGVDRARLEIEVENTLGQTPALSTIQTSRFSVASVKQDTEEFRTDHPYILGMCLVVVGLIFGASVAYTAGFTHGVSAVHGHQGVVNSTSVRRGYDLIWAAAEQQQQRVDRSDAIGGEGVRSEEEKSAAGRAAAAQVTDEAAAAHAASGTTAVQAASGTTAVQADSEATQAQQAQQL